MTPLNTVSRRTFVASTAVLACSVVGSVVYTVHHMQQKPAKFIKCKDHSNIETWINPDTIRWIEKRNNGQYHICTSNTGCYPWQTYQVIDEDNINIMIGK
jgi:hypothetical protein